MGDDQIYNSTNTNTIDVFSKLLFKCVITPVPFDSRGKRKAFAVYRKYFFDIMKAFVLFAIMASIQVRMKLDNIYMSSACFNRLISLYRLSMHTIQETPAQAHQHHHHLRLMVKVFRKQTENHIATKAKRVL